MCSTKCMRSARDLPARYRGSRNKVQHASAINSRRKAWAAIRRGRVGSGEEKLARTTEGEGAGLLSVGDIGNPKALKRDPRVEDAEGPARYHFSLYPRRISAAEERVFRWFSKRASEIIVQPNTRETFTATQPLPERLWLVEIEAIGEVV
ncbi:hypothetical protein B0H17DRAFT_1127731 [Mycena rosella]|uniref:Uncharacterized protein n=1 Tax=Mycena rosella TaxID=1033263 RepID=A0AAD7E129_MYCRO|nr:hypothetical protein B0H17DRAFT_1127731 [Mycena rosella]